MTQRSRIVLTLGLAVSLAPLLLASTSGMAGKKSGRHIPVKGSAAKGTTGQSSTLLPDGRVLLLGGEGPDGPLATAATRDPQTGATVSLSTQLRQPRAWHTASLLPDGTVLVVGGIGSDGSVLDTAESFDPTTLTFQAATATGLTPRAHHTATLLTNGSLLITGGISGNGDMSISTELWSFRTKAATPLPRGLLLLRQDQTATLLPDGTVLLWGGTQGSGMSIPDGELFDPTSNTFRLQTSRSLRSVGVTPEVKSTIPDDGAENVSVSVLISMRFSEPLKVQTVNANCATLTSSAGSVSVKVVPAEGGILAFMSPATPLLAGTNYTVTIAGASDPNGTPLPSTSFSFTTAGPVTPSDTGILGTAQSPASDPTDSPFRKLPPLKAPAGVTAISGQVLLLDGQPLEGVTLRVGKNHAETDRTGRFLLRDVSGSHVAMVIDGRTANEKRVTYGVFENGVDIASGQTNVLKYTIWMPVIDTVNALTLSVPTTKEIVVTTPRIPGLELHIPAGTTISDIDGKVANQVSITPIPIKQPPFPLPPGVNVPVYFTVQPGGGYLSVQNSSGPKGAWLVYPNSFHQIAGSSFDFWNYDANNKGWFIYGHGKVAQDGTKILPDQGVLIYEFTGAMVGASAIAAQIGAWLRKQWCKHVGWVGGAGLGCAGDPVDLGTGLFVYEKQDFYLPDVIPIVLTRVYRPNDGASRAFGVGTSHSYDLFLVGDTFPYTYMDPVFEDGGRIHFPRISPGTSFADAVYRCNSAPGEFFASTIAWNGNGWTLTRRDGMRYQFPDGFNSTRPQQNGLLSITDRNGNVLSISRDSQSNISQITSPNGRWIQFTYDANFRITQFQDNIGRTVQYSYDTGGRLVQVTDANGGIWAYHYDANNNMTSLIDPRLVTYLQNQYDSQNRVIKQILADGSSTYQFSYNPTPCGTNCSGIWETDVTDPNGSVEKVTFNAPPTFSNGFVTGGTLSSLTYAAGTTISQTFTNQFQPGTNLVTSTLDSLNRNTSYTYDSLGNLTSTTKLVGTPNATTTTISYDPTFSQVVGITDPLNRTTSLTYDSKGNLLSMTTPGGATSTLTRNAAGQIVSITNPVGATSSFNYDGADLSSATDPLGRTFNLFSDSGGRVIAYNDSMGARRTFAYNPLDQVTQIVDPNGGLTQLGYDAVGNLTGVTDPKNTANPTIYVYDNFDRLSTYKDRLGNQASYQYDGNDNLTQFTDRRGKVAIFSYDALNRRTFAGFGKAGSTYESTIGYTFDGGNRLTQTVDSVGGTITRGFDDFDRPTSETTPQGTVGYTYDAVNRRATMTVPGQSTINYSYDSTDRLTQITQASATVSFTYDAADRKTTVTLPNGITATLSYDNASELTGIVYSNQSTGLGNLTYGYDLAGRRNSIVGNYARVNIPTAATTASYNADNELTTWGTTNLFYDQNGNMISDGTHSYTWNARNQLASIDTGSTATFTYDAFGRRLSKSVFGTNTAFLYDGPNVIQEIIGGTNVANSLTGAVDEVFQRTDSAGARAFLSDALGNTIALADGTGALLTQYTYEPFGNVTSSGATTTNSFTFTGREADATGLDYYRARYYSPTLTRFLSPDPIDFAGGINLYGYTADGPTQRTDPFGLDPSAKHHPRPKTSNPTKPGAPGSNNNSNDSNNNDPNKDNNSDDNNKDKGKKGCTSDTQGYTDSAKSNLGDFAKDIAGADGAAGDPPPGLKIKKPGDFWGYLKNPVEHMRGTYDDIGNAVRCAGN